MTDQHPKKGEHASDVPSSKQSVSPADAGQELMSSDSAPSAELGATRLSNGGVPHAGVSPDSEHLNVTLGSDAEFSAGDAAAEPCWAATEFEDYEILDELGRGGMGVVYRARELSTQRIVCIKMILGGKFASAEALRRFQVETEAGAHLDHPNIVPIYRTGAVQGVPYFVMKYVEGTGLDRVPRDQFKSNPRAAVALIVKICRAVHFAHARGILHRDLKPANIVLDEQGEPYITDFGLAKRIDDDAGQTRMGTIVGTPDYMSPEQAVGRHDLVTVTSDVYSLGSMLFELLAGQPPFKSESVVETLSRVTNEPAGTPMMLNERIGRDLETICLKCLEKDPNRRFPSAASLADELDRYLRGEPIESRSVSAPERLWRWCRRNPLAASLGASLLVLLVTVAIGSSVAAYQINIRKNEAVVARQKAEQAQLLADENAHIANQQRTLALDTLHSLVTSVESKLRDRTDLADLQSEILQDAFEGLQEVSRTAENVGLADRTVGVAHQRMADLLEKLGKTVEAIEQHRLAIAIFEPLFASHPGDDWAKWNAAISYDKLGDQALGTDAAEASQWYRKSTVLREQLAQISHQAEITATMRQHALAISAARVGGLALAQGDPREASTYFRKALEQSEAMLQADPNNRQGQVAVAGASALLGSVSFRLGANEEAHQYYQRALDMRRTIYQQDAQSVLAADLLTKSYETFGDFKLQTNQTREAEELYAASVQLLEDLFAKDANNAEIKGSLATMYYKLATVRLLLNQPAEAEAMYVKCLNLREELSAADPGDPQKQIALMLAQARCGKHQDAAAVADHIALEAAENAGTLFYVACGYALSAAAITPHAEDTSPSQELRSLRDKYVQQAIDTLDKAVQLGYRDAVSLETDPDLEPVRGTPAFQRLIAALRQPPESQTP